MNPARVRELSRDGDKVLALIDAIPRADRGRDIEGFLDAKRAARTALRTLLAEMRNSLPCGEPARPLFASRRAAATFVSPSRRRPG